MVSSQTDLYPYCHYYQAPLPVTLILSTLASPPSCRVQYTSSLLKAVQLVVEGEGLCYYNTGTRDKGILPYPTGLTAQARVRNVVWNAQSFYCQESCNEKRRFKMVILIYKYLRSPAFCMHVVTTSTSEDSMRQICSRANEIRFGIVTYVFIRGFFLHCSVQNS